MDQEVSRPNSGLLSQQQEPKPTQPEPLPQHWRKVERDDQQYPHSSFRRFTYHYEREDGAAVFENPDEYWAMPWLKGHRRWSASGPAPEETLLTFHHILYRRGGKQQSLFATTRRWKSPEAAMKAVDREHPL